MNLRLNSFSVIGPLLYSLEIRALNEKIYKTVDPFQEYGNTEEYDEFHRQKIRTKISTKWAESGERDNEKQSDG